MVVYIGSEVMQNWLWVIAAMYYPLSRVSMCVIGQKACDRCCLYVRIIIMDVSLVMIYDTDRRMNSQNVFCSDTLILVYFSSLFLLCLIKWIWKCKYEWIEGKHY